MSRKNPATNELILKYDSSELTPAQIRLIKRVHATLANVLTTDEESEYFEESAELLRICAHLIQNSHFSDDKIRNQNIPYAEQAIEYSVECLQEQLARGQSISIDN